MEKRKEGAKIPQLSDLRESGAIEQDADMVLFIYRPEYYGLSEDENANSTLGMAEVSVAKHRNGALRDVRLKFIGQYTKFADADDFEFTDEGPMSHAGNFERERLTRGSRMNDMGDDPNMPF